MLSTSNLHPAVKTAERLAKRIAPINRSAWLGNDITNSTHQYGEFHKNPLNQIVNTKRSVWTMEQIQKSQVQHLVNKWLP